MNVELPLSFYRYGFILFLKWLTVMVSGVGSRAYFENRRGCVRAAVKFKEPLLWFPMNTERWLLIRWPKRDWLAGVVKSPVCFNYEIDSRTGHRFVNHAFDPVRHKCAIFLVLFVHFDSKMIAGTLLSSHFVTKLFRVCVIYAVSLLVYTSSEILTRGWFSGIYMSYCQNRKMKVRKKLYICRF